MEAMNNEKKWLKGATFFRCSQIIMNYCDCRLN